MSVEVSYIQGLLDKAALLKDEGSILFKEQQFNSAKAKYQEALKVLEPQHFYNANEKECQILKDLTSSLLFNVGTCLFNQQKWKDADYIYSEALTVKPTYVKALFKRAMARY